MRLPDESRISLMTCGVMMIPRSAMPSATIAICSVVAMSVLTDVPWPNAEYAWSGALLTSSAAVGKLENTHIGEVERDLLVEPERLGLGVQTGLEGHPHLGEGRVARPGQGRLNGAGADLVVVVAQM